MTLTIRRPDDWHVHLRDGKALALTVQDTARHMGRAIVMPNLKPPVTSVDDALAYRERILAYVPEGSGFEPLMTLYLTDETSPSEIAAAARTGVIPAVKLYPAGATTNSASGVTDIRGRYAVFQAMEEHGLKLLVHGEVTSDSVDIFDRERAFLTEYLADIAQTFPRLKIVLEHITTSEAVEFIERAPATVGATITAHHLLFNRNHMLAGGIRPHLYCLPILKRSSHQEALVRAATSGNPKFFLGTDSAPHSTETKESDCGCAGCYTSFAALELYATAFEAAGKLDALQGFASEHGPHFYGLPVNSETLTLKRDTWTAPASLPLGEGLLTPLMANQEISWRVLS
jgi:dihydroorotase